MYTVIDCFVEFMAFSCQLVVSQAEFYSNVGALLFCVVLLKKMSGFLAFVPLI